MVPFTNNPLDLTLALSVHRPLASTWLAFRPWHARNARSSHENIEFSRKKKNTNKFWRGSTDDETPGGWERSLKNNLYKFSDSHRGRFHSRRPRCRGVIWIFSGMKKKIHPSPNNDNNYGFYFLGWFKFGYGNRGVNSKTSLMASEIYDDNESFRK